MDVERYPEWVNPQQAMALLEFQSRSGFYSFLKRCEDANIHIDRRKRPGKKNAAAFYKRDDLIKAHEGETGQPFGFI
jgi:hypothetical protein